MLKKFLTCFSFLFIFAMAATVSAKPVELTGIDAFDLDDETLRIEISYSGGKLDAENISTDLSEGLLRVELDNALPGRVSRVSGTQIQSDARNYVEKILANKTQDKHTSIQIHFKSDVEGNLKTSLEPANRSEKKSARIVLDVKKSSAPNDEDQNYYVAANGRHNRKIRFVRRFAQGAETFDGFGLSSRHDAHNRY